MTSSKTLVTIDPGVSSGIVVGAYSDTEPYQRTHAFQIEGGLSGFKKFFSWALQDIDCHSGYGEYALELGRDHWWDDETDIEFVVEKFTPRPNGGGSGLSLKTVEPLRIEGFLVGTDVVNDYIPGGKNPEWAQPQQQYFCGGRTLPEKKKRARAFLKEHDLLLTGKQVGRKDADDANSATLHALSYLRRRKHLPTLAHYFQEEN